MKKILSALLLLPFLACSHAPPEAITPPDARAPKYVEPPPPPYNPHFEHVETEADTRSDAEIAAAACTSALDTGWRCKKPGTPVKALPWPKKKAGVEALSAGGGTAVIPASWTVGHWFVDPQNSSGTASDFNNCTTSATACLTWQEIATHRWGCGNDQGCVRLRQTTDVKFLSAHTGNTDPVYAVMALENSGSFTIFAALPTPTVSASFTSVTNWNGCSGTAHVSDTVNTIGVHGAFVRDTTVGASMWCDEFSTTHSCQMSQPMTNATSPPSSFQTPGLWTNVAGGAGTLGSTDNYSEYNNLVAVDVVATSPVMADYTGATPTNGVFLYNIQVLDPSGTPGTNPILWGGDVVAYESRIDRVINLQGVSTKDDGCVNCWINGGLTGGRLGTGHYWHGNAGEITSNATIINVTGLGVALDAYIMQENAATFAQGVSFGLVRGDFSTPTLSGYSTLSAISPGYAAVGNGVQLCIASATLNVVGNGSLRYDSSHGGSAGVITSGTLEIGGSTTAESHSGTGTVTVTNGITINQTNLDNAASATAFGGAAYWKGGFIGTL